MQKNWKRLVGTALLSMAVGAVGTTPLFGQGPFRGGRHGPGGPGGEYRRPESSRGGDRGPGRSWGGYRGPADDQSRLERYEAFLRSLDFNHNGRIDRGEAEGPRGYFVRRLAERAGLEQRFPLSISQIREGLKKNYLGSNSQRGSGASGASRASGDKSGSAEPLVPGFGVEQKETPRVLKFGERAEKGSGHAASASSRSSSPSSSSSGSSQRSDTDERYRNWAQAMMRQYDKNKNGKLERDEWTSRWGDPKQADRNHDGVITQDELAAGLREYSRRRAGGSRSHSFGSSGSSASKSASDSTASDGRKSYRFLSPTERLPEGLPDWFAPKDADGDGQVAMAEYSTFWTAAKAVEFTRFDLNQDGMITPRECLRAEKLHEKEGKTAKPKTSTKSDEVTKSEKKESGGLWDGW